MTIGSIWSLEDAPRITYREPVRGTSAAHGFDEINANRLFSQAGRIRLGNIVDPSTTGASIIRNYLAS